MMKSQQMKQREEEIRSMEEDLKPTEMGDMENVIGPNNSLSKRKDKSSTRTNAKKLKLSKLEEWVKSQWNWIQECLTGLQDPAVRTRRVILSSSGTSRQEMGRVPR